MIISDPNTTTAHKLRKLVYTSETIKSTNDDIAKQIANLELLTQSISHAVTELETNVAASDVSSSHGVTGFYSLAGEDSDELTGLPEPVCDVLSVNFDELTVESILQQFPISETLRGGRKVEYFGNVSYSYGGYDHKPKPYPDCPVFDVLFDKLSREVDSEITRENYTCLITLYENGGVGIPRHHDNVEQVPNENIYAVSIGAERVMKFTRTSGKVLEYNVTLPHGSVYSMSTASQEHWAHSISPDPSITAPRISFTFRKLTGPKTADKVIVPPIQPPTTYAEATQSNSKGSYGRVLMLTDSILKHTPEHLFNKVGNYRAVKRINYELVNVLNYEPEFKFSDFVVISCGINDLARFKKTPLVLADLVLPKLKEVQCVPSIPGRHLFSRRC